MRKIVVVLSDLEGHEKSLTNILNDSTVISTQKRITKRQWQVLM